MNTKWEQSCKWNTLNSSSSSMVGRKTNVCAEKHRKNKFKNFIGKQIFLCSKAISSFSSKKTLNVCVLCIDKSAWMSIENSNFYVIHICKLIRNYMKVLMRFDEFSANFMVIEKWKSSWVSILFHSFRICWCFSLSNNK